MMQERQTAVRSVLVTAVFLILFFPQICSAQKVVPGSEKKIWSAFSTNDINFLATGDCTIHRTPNQSVWLSSSNTSLSGGDVGGGTLNILTFDENWEFVDAWIFGADSGFSAASIYPPIDANVEKHLFFDGFFTDWWYEWEELAGPDLWVVLVENEGGEDCNKIRPDNKDASSTDPINLISGDFYFGETDVLTDIIHES